MIASPITVAPTNNYRELAIVTDNGKFATYLSRTGVLTIRHGDLNPEHLIIDDALLPIPKDLPAGTLLIPPVVGIVYYSYGMYKILPITELQYIYEQPEKTCAVPPGNDQLNIAVYNVENLAVTDRYLRFETQADHVVNFLHCPDLVIFTEVQDNDGKETSTVVDASGREDHLLRYHSPEYSLPTGRTPF